MNFFVLIHLFLLLFVSFNDLSFSRLERCGGPHMINVYYSSV